MPIMTSELAQGYATGRTKSEGSTGITYTRVFKVLLSSPNEGWDIQQVCGIHIGDYYPSDNRVTCTSFQDRADGDSRVVRLVTFEYSDKADAGDSSEGGGAGGGSGSGSSQNKAPDVRPANFSTSVGMMEVPCMVARQYGSAANPNQWGDWMAPLNPTKDLYEGIMRLEPVMTITVEHFEDCNPTKGMKYVGDINSAEITFPPVFPDDCDGETVLKMAPHTLMFQGVSHKASIEVFGDVTYRGWSATYTFTYRRNPASVQPTPGTLEDIGWDMAVPQVGRNIHNFGLNDATVEQGALHYEMDNNSVKPNWAGRILVPPIANNNNNKMPANVSIGAADGGITQRPASSPIPLNDNGTPRASTQSPAVLVYRVQVHDESDLFDVLGLRFTA